MDRKNIFVLGLDDFNHKELQLISGATGYNFETLMTFDDIFGPQAPGIQELLPKAEEILKNYDGAIDGIIGYWDFPVTSMVPCLCDAFDLPGPNLEGVIKCEHKYWSRLEQSRAIDEFPGFDAVNPFDDDAVNNLNVDYPFWLKPVKATASQLGFKIENEEDFLHAQKIIKENITRFSGPFNYLLSKIDLPDFMKDIDGSYCIAEEIIKGSQCTVSGFVHNGKVTVYGIVDSINYPDSSSFFRYEYPSTLPVKVQRRMTEDSIKIIEQIGLDNSTFNIEYFYDEAFDRIWTLEVNPRLSQSHSYLYRVVDGEPNFKIMIDLALGNTPEMPHRNGRFNRVAKFFLRSFNDGFVSGVSGEVEMQQVKELIPGIRIDLNAQADMRLSDLPRQDSYSYDLAHIFIGASDRDELLDRYHRSVDMLNFCIEDQ